jgi:hypothetical protein
VRNSGWYIPFWRKPKRPQSEASQTAEKPEKPEREKRRRPRTRSEAELERVREEWVARYTRQVQAFRTLGLSVGTPQDDIEERYNALVARLNGSDETGEHLRRLQEAFETLRRSD